MRIAAAMLVLLFIAGCREVIMPNDPMPAVVNQPKKVSTNGKAAKAQAEVVTSRHPRLLVTSADFERAKTSNDVMVRRWSEEVIADARKFLAEAPPKYEAAKGIEIARKLQLRVTHFATAYRLTGDMQFADRARQDLLEAAKFPNWDQPSFLATAETTATVAIGYDWLFDVLSEADRATLRSAIVDKGLRAGLAAYKKKDFWVEAKHNWNLVGNGGMIVGALAVADDEPSVAKSVIAQARSSLQNGLGAFAPDGGWEEGPTYWNYATRYLCFALTSLRNVYGTDFNLDRAPGLANTGDFRIQCIGPTDKNFNFADSTEATGDSPQMFALARLFNRPAYAAFETARNHTDPPVLDLLWYVPADHSTLVAKELDDYFRGAGVVAFRSRWDDPGATYVAFKGGSNKAHHGHLDLGSFVLDAGGQRWAIDLGSDEYGKAGYFDSPTRWTYYRCSTAGHNSITLESRPNQDEDADAPLVAFTSTKARAHAVIDMTSAYHLFAKRLLRGVALLNRQDVLVQDEIALERPGFVTWTMHTRANVSLDGRTATLTQNGAKLTARLLYPPGVDFTVAPATAPAGQAQQPDVTKLMVHFKANEPTHIAVLFTPAVKPPQIPKLTPVSTWSDEENLAPRHEKGEKNPMPSWVPIFGRKR